jgi:hypothetical protein
MEIRQSSVEGLGVFATDRIPARTILEEVPFVLFPRYTNIAKKLYDVLKGENWVSTKERHLENLRENLRFKDPEKYYFKWTPPVPFDGDSLYTVLPLGYGPIYNTSNTSNNADWQIKGTLFEFSAERDIEKDEEIRTFYGYFLGEDGSSFNCDTVFNFGIDTFNGVHRVRMLRFGAIESFKAAKNNPSAYKTTCLIDDSIEGLAIQNIRLLNTDGSESVRFDVPQDIRLSQLYMKIAEAKMNATPMVGFTFEYRDKKEVSHIETVVFKK